MLPLALLWHGGVCAADTVRLLDALDALRGQGYSIFYSSDLVTPFDRIEVASIDFAQVRAALPALGLRLVAAQHGSWLIERDPAWRPALSFKLTSSDGEPIAAAVFKFDHGGRAVVRGAAGSYSVRAPPDAARVTILAKGHYPLTVELAAVEPAVTLQAIARIETLTVTGSRYVLAGYASAGSVATLSSQELTDMPSLAGDSMRATTALPGMSSVGVSAKPLVRGGTQDETLTLLDGVELLDPYHLDDFQSFFSSVDPALIDETNVYTGGFPARYGNRMSGVVDMSTATSPIEPRTEIGLSMLAASANTRGQSDDRDTDWLASVRHGNLEYLADWIDRGWGSPAFDDAYARVSRHFGDATGTVGTLLSRDDVGITDNDQKARSDIETAYVWTRLDVTHSDVLDSSTMLAYTQSDRDKHLRSADPNGSTGFLNYRQHLWRLAVKSDVSYRDRGRAIDFGVDLAYGECRYDSTAVIDRGPIATLLGTPQLEAFAIDTEPSGWSGGAYWSAELRLSDRLALLPGIRGDFQTYYQGRTDSQVSPRIGLRWEASPTMTGRLSVGRYFQPEALYEMKANDGIDHFFSPQRADHVVVGLDWVPSSAWRVTTEVYSKDYRQTSPRFENVSNRFVLAPELEPDRVLIDVNHAIVRGVDWQARFDLSEHVSGSLRYGYMDADDRFGGTWEPRGWSQRHTAQGEFVWHGDAATLAARITWHSGWRTTRLPLSAPVGATIPLGDIYDQNVLNDYLSMDFSASRTWRIGRTAVTLSGDLTNASNHANRGGVDYRVRESPPLVVFEPNNKSLLPWVPTVGITVAF